MRLRFSHATTYTYDDDVTDSLGIAYLTPRELPYQRVSAAALKIDPSPADSRTDTDQYGNVVTYFQVTDAHRRLELVATGEVEVDNRAYDEATLALPWEQCRPAERPDVAEAWLAQDFALPSPVIDQPAVVREYAAESLTPGRPIGDALTHLMHRIYADFEYKPGSTTVTSTIAEVFADRKGVCQDFAHVTIACLRSHGLAARYASGYLATDPPPGKERVVGADATHAWAACWLPDGVWGAIDPTNDQWVNDRYILGAYGRDYSDVPPVKGVIFTDAKKSTLDVSVDVDSVF